MSLKQDVICHFNNVLVIILLFIIGKCALSIEQDISHLNKMYNVIITKYKSHLGDVSGYFNKIQVNKDVCYVIIMRYKSLL